MSRRPSPEALRVWQSFLRYHRATIGELDQHLRAAAGTTLDEYDVLVQLHDAPGRARRMGDLVAATLIARSSCTRVVDRLVERGDVVRSSAPGDGRTVVVTLTSTGRRRLAVARTQHLADVGRVFADRLDAAEIATLAELLARLEQPGADPQPGRARR